MAKKVLSIGTTPPFRITVFYARHHSRCREHRPYIGCLRYSKILANALGVPAIPSKGSNTLLASTAGGLPSHRSPTEPGCPILSQKLPLVFQLLRKGGIRFTIPHALRFHDTSVRGTA